MMPSKMEIMAHTMNVSGAESLSNSANIFVGQTEAPLCVRPFIERMTRSELMAIMVGGFANTAGGEDNITAVAFRIAAGGASGSDVPADDDTMTMPAVPEPVEPEPVESESQGEPDESAPRRFRFWRLRR